MIPKTEVELLLRGWHESKRRLRVTARFGDLIFSGFCRVYEVTSDGVCFDIGCDERDKIAFVFDGWAFEFSDPPPEGDRILPVGGKVESVIVWVKPKDSLTVMLLEE